MIVHFATGLEAIGWGGGPSCSPLGRCTIGLPVGPHLEVVQINTQVYREGLNAFIHHWFIFWDCIIWISILKIFINDFILSLCKSLMKTLLAFLYDWICFLFFFLYWYLIYFYLLSNILAFFFCFTQDFKKLLWEFNEGVKLWLTINDNYHCIIISRKFRKSISFYFRINIELYWGNIYNKYIQDINMVPTWTQPLAEETEDIKYTHVFIHHPITFPSFHWM